MRGLWLAIVWVAGAAAADPYCKPDAAEMAALPSGLAGDWLGDLVQGVAVQEGKPRLLPEGAAPTPARLAAVAGGLRYSDATAPDGIDLAAGAVAENFALPGESPLLAEELLRPQIAAEACDLKDIPQFQGSMPMANAVTARFHAYVVSGDDMLMVMQVGQLGPLAKPSDMAVRAVLRFRRVPR